MSSLNLVRKLRERVAAMILHMQDIDLYLSMLEAQLTAERTEIIAKPTKKRKKEEL